MNAGTNDPAAPTKEKPVQSSHDASIDMPDNATAAASTKCISPRDSTLRRYNQRAGVERPAPQASNISGPNVSIVVAARGNGAALLLRRRGRGGGRHGRRGCGRRIGIPRVAHVQ